MTPSLRELLERHPAPWSLSPDCCWAYDANHTRVCDLSSVHMSGSQDTDDIVLLFVELVNAAAAEVGR